MHSEVVFPVLIPNLGTIFDQMENMWQLYVIYTFQDVMPAIGIK